MNAEFIQNRISMLLKERNMSEYELSMNLAKSKGYIQSITSGRALPSMQLFLNICDSFNITPSEFFDEDKTASLEYLELCNNIKDLSSADIKMLNAFAKRLKNSD